MAVLHSYAQSTDKTGYYLRGWTPETGSTTIQTRQVCEDLFEWLGFSVGDQIPHDLLNGLLEVGLLYTGDRATGNETIPDDFDFGRDVKSVLTEEQHNRLIGFVKSYGDQAPLQVANLIDRLDARTVVVGDSYIPSTSAEQDRQHNDTGEEVDHGRFEEIIEEIYNDNTDEEVVDPLSELSPEYSSANAAISYHRNHQEVIKAQADDDSLEYATQALTNTDDKTTAGPVCGFRVNISGTDLVVAEVIVNPDDPTKQLSYGEQGIRHRVVLGDETIEFETTLSEQSQYTRSELLEHQVQSLQILETTLERHPGISKEGMISQVVEGGYLERGIRSTQNVWQDSSLLGELLPPVSAEKKATGIVDFFNDTGGYGFIETDAREEDIFYHMEDIGGADIQEGEKLRFNIVEADEGPRATGVERL